MRGCVALIGSCSISQTLPSLELLALMDQRSCARSEQCCDAWLRSFEQHLSSPAFPGIPCLHGSTSLRAAKNAVTQGIRAVVDAVLQRVEAVAKGVPEGQLKQAKQVAISSYKEGLASSAGMVGTMAPKLLLTGRFEPSDFAAQVEALSPSDVSSFIADGLKRTPSVVSYGSMASAPRLGGVVNKRLA
ncbi:hypothetical protein DUNSADRAFT_7960 [Dunaliella salina]|uniref:Uncharacterized protein n=1 Tax=Dunaliella salina TaxID=3046 RepID=A0ABQ7H618_DUNSA|nr:hypothetical protein DUNSADRAFT_7960 [Dunaliella salina]|eukprot:KAF5842307.1 hypothetical protein DUNSADRAFT_7960 [Dunaliella salina]